MTDGKGKFAMQTRCIYCHKEQYAPAVWEISNGNIGCAWCGKVPPKMTYEEYHNKHNCGRTNGR